MYEDNKQLSIVIVSYNRSAVLIDTIEYIFQLDGYTECLKEIIIVDQTECHTPQAQERLSDWNQNGIVQWVRLAQPDLTGAMNRGLLEAQSQIVLYLDDDIIPHKNLLVAHLDAHQQHPSTAAVIGQILQPGQSPERIDYTSNKKGLTAFMDFPFNSTHACFIENAMAGNMSLKRVKALQVGGFDEQFIPPVAARFESEFAKRLVSAKQKIWFAPGASIRHLAVASGGTRARGSHLNSAEPYFGFGDYYFALKHGTPRERVSYCIRRFFREVRTKYHLARPWYIPVKWVGELRAFAMAIKASRKPAKLISQQDLDKFKKSNLR